MADFLLELLSEEIPARMQEKASADLARMFTDELAKAGLKAESLTSHVTPRRLALIARGLPLETAAISEELKGPRADAPEQALAGFLGKTGLTRDQLVEREDAKGNKVLFAVIEKPGRATADVLAQAIPAIVRGFPWPKSMRSGVASSSTASLRWVRPLQGIIALLGDDVVPVEIDGVVSGAATVGHRFHHSGPITIGNADDYAAKLRACHVVVDAEERRSIIRDRIAKLAADAGLSVIPDEGLIAENAGLTEWPVPLLGHFDPSFLEVPREVIQLTLRTNQKYFVLNDAGGKLAPAFICTANIDAKDGGAAIVAGNGKVLAARLSDAKFFWEQDLRIPLAESAKKLDQIVFHEKLGTVADKVDRVAKLARWLVEEGAIVPDSVRVERSRDTSAGERPSTSLGTNGDVGALADLAEQAARLAKADLVTGMVGEFPELQGIMGGYYARAEGLPDAVADAIRDHYKPVGQGDYVPTEPVTVAVSLADKLDTLTAFFGIDEIPSGSRDPFALRRAALGILRLILTNNLRFDLQGLITVALTFHGHQWWRKLIAVSERLDAATSQTWELVSAVASQGKELDAQQPEPVLKALLRARLSEDKETEAAFHFGLWKRGKVVAFLGERLTVQQRDYGIRPDVISAVFDQAGEGDIVRLLARVKALQGFVETADGTNLLAGYKRAANILKKEGGAPEGASATPDYDAEPAEAALVAALDIAQPTAQAAVDAEDFAGAMTALAALRGPIDAFFDKVTVNDPSPHKRNTRLAVLEKFRAAVHKVADFSKIEG